MHAYLRLLLLLCLSLACGMATASPSSAAKLTRGARTTVQNALWADDAWPTSPSLQPGGRLSIAYFNSTGGGRVTLLHLVLCRARADNLLRNIAIAITYDDQPYPSVFVPAGDFFMEHSEDGVPGDANTTYQSAHYETQLLAFRPTYSYYSYFHMPYRKSIRIELVGAEALKTPVGCESWVQHSDVPFDAEEDAYFHAHFAYHPALAFPWQPAIFAPSGGWSGPGQLVGINMRFSAAPELADKFAGNMNHICEGNWELYLDNRTALFGNDTNTDIAKQGYQASEHVVVVTGSEDMFGYSFGWASPAAGLLTGTPLWVQGAQAKTFGVQLSTYRFFDAAPIQFESSLHAQVNWHYDTGHNVPADLCPPETGCSVEYDVMTYLYLAAPAKASNATFPWGRRAR